MKISRTVIIIFIILIFLVLLKIFFLDKKTPVNTAPQGKQQKSPVNILVVQTRNIENKINATGTILSNEQVDVMTEIPGRIEKIFFKEGGKVQKGDILIKINDSDYQAQLKKLRLSLKLAEEKESRQKKLLEISGVSQEEYDISLNLVNSLKADIEFTSSQLAKTQINAPFSGVIGLKQVSEGSYISPAIKITTLQQTNPVKIDFSIPEKYTGSVHLNDIVKFTVPGSDSVFTGQIYAIEPHIDPVSRTLPLRAICSNHSGTLIPGSFARIELQMNTIANAVMIPTQALIPELKGQKVFVSKNGKAAEIKVKTGIRTATDIQITEGLQNGDSVIIAGFMQLKPGSDLLIKKE